LALVGILCGGEALSELVVIPIKKHLAFEKRGIVPS
jgi:hypothetical protein